MITKLIIIIIIIIIRFNHSYCDLYETDHLSSCAKTTVISRMILWYERLSRMVKYARIDAKK